MGVKRPRSKYIDQKQKQQAYDCRRRKTYKAGIKRKKALIYLLAKGLDQLQVLLNDHPQIGLTLAERAYLRTIKTVLQQQTFLLTHPPKAPKISESPPPLKTAA